MRRTRWPSLQFVFDDEWQARVRLEELYRSGLNKTQVRRLVEEARQRHYARKADRDPYHSWHGRLVDDWLQTLPRTGSANSTELYAAFVRWLVEWTDVDPTKFTHTRWGRIIGHWVHKGRTNRGVVYYGISLP